MSPKDSTRAIGFLICHVLNIHMNKIIRILPPIFEVRTVCDAGASKPVPKTSGAFGYSEESLWIEDSTSVLVSVSKGRKIGTSPVGVHSVRFGSSVGSPRHLGTVTKSDWGSGWVDLFCMVIP